MMLSIWDASRVGSDYGGAAGGGDEHVGMLSRMAGDGLRPLGADGAAGEHGLEEVGEGDVGGVFDLVGVIGGCRCIRRAAAPLYGQLAS